MFLRTVDPLDKIMSGKNYTSDDKDYFEMLLKTHYPTATGPKTPTEAAPPEGQTEAV